MSARWVGGFLGVEGGRMDRNWDDAPARVPIFFGDVPKRDESLPKFLDDGDYAKFMLARTGMRVGKLHNDRFIALLPHLVELIAEYQASNGPFTPGRLLSGAEGPLNRYRLDTQTPPSYSLGSVRSGVG